MDLIQKLRHIMDFPRQGVDFIDITNLLKDPDAFKESIDKMKELTKTFGEFDIIAGTEARGFLFGAPLAYLLGKGFIPIRKEGKLPCETVKSEYCLEYGTGVLEMHKDAIIPGQRIVLADDLIATGGTTAANIAMIEQAGGIVSGIVYFIELAYLNGRDKLKNYKVESVIKIRKNAEGE